MGEVNRDGGMTMIDSIAKERPTYTMTYTCSNCGHVFNKEVSRGVHADGQGGECPYCGMSDKWSRSPFTYTKKYY